MILPAFLRMMYQ